MSGASRPRLGKLTCKRNVNIMISGLLLESEWTFKHWHTSRLMLSVTLCVLAEFFAFVLAELLCLSCHSLAVHPNSTLFSIPIVGSAF